MILRLYSRSFVRSSSRSVLPMPPEMWVTSAARAVTARVSKAMAAIARRNDVFTKADGSSAWCLAAQIEAVLAGEVDELASAQHTRALATRPVLSILLRYLGLH